jgi:hypothetical protein
MVHGETLEDAILTAWMLRVNPGGEVASLEVPPTVETHVASKWIGRLLTREEAEQFDREIAPHGVS